MPSFDPSSLPDQSAKIFIVTGGNAGIGREAILHLVRKNAIVYMGCRSATKGAEAKETILELVPNAIIHILIMDHLNLKSVVAAAKEFKSKESKLHGLINNAGIMAVAQETSSDGWESQWQTNYLSHFLLTHHLLPVLLMTARVSLPGDVRIVNVSSMGHKLFAPKVGIDFNDINQKKGDPWSRYGQSKLANILHSKQLDKLYGPGKLDKGEIWAISLHPGNMYTDLTKNARFLPGIPIVFSRTVAAMMHCLGVYISAEKGAYTTVYSGASEEIKGDISGKYLVPFGKVEIPSKSAQDMEMAKKLWDWTMKEFETKGLL